MRKQKLYSRAARLRSNAVMFSLVLALVSSLAGLSLSTRVDAAQTVTAYCSRYTANSQLNACKGGIKGNDCSDYAVTFDQETADICTKSAKAKADGQVSDTSDDDTLGNESTDAEVYKNVVTNACTPYKNDSAAALWCLYGGLGQNGTEGKPKSVQDCLTKRELQGSSRNQSACVTGVTAGQSFLNAKNGNTEETGESNENLNQIQDLLDQTKSLTEYLDVLHGLGKDSQTDLSGESSNNRDSYTNGAGKQQAIKVTPCASNPGTGQTASNGNGGSGQGADSSGLGNMTNILSQLGLGGGATSNSAETQKILDELDEEQDNGNNDATQNLLSQLGLNNNSSDADIQSILGQLGGNSGGTTSSSSSNNNGGITINNITINNSGGGGSGGCPAILFFNGGGWHSNDHTSDMVTEGSAKKNGGDNESYGKPVGGGATERGFTTFDVTYRLGSSGVYYMFEDIMRGIQHVRNNAGMYGIDANKIAIWGDSAGGSLAMRAAASGKSGAKVAVGWSAPTNAFTALFKSYKSFLIGMDHSTCVPTDLAGMTNFTDLLNGGSGDVAEYGQGISSNDFSGLGLSGGGAGPLPTGFTNPLSGGVGGAIGTITELLTAAQYASETGQNLESLSSQLESGGIQGMSGSLINLSSKKLVECMDNINALSPALFASPDSPPGYLSGFTTDDLIDPQQLYDMRDKLLSLGVRSEALVLEGDPNTANPAFGATDNHLGYDPRFVCPTLNFVESVLDPNKELPDCVTGKTPSQAATDANAGAPGGGANSNGGAAGDSNGGNGGTAQNNGQGTTTSPGGRPFCNKSGTSQWNGYEYFDIPDDGSCVCPAGYPQIGGKGGFKDYACGKPSPAAPGPTTPVYNPKAAYWVAVTASCSFSHRESGRINNNASPPAPKQIKECVAR